MKIARKIPQYLIPRILPQKMLKSNKGERWRKVIGLRL
jgi:hypothetical protein